MDKTRIPTNSKIWPDSTCAISVRRKGQILLVVGINPCFIHYFGDQIELNNNKLGKADCVGLTRRVVHEIFTLFNNAKTKSNFSLANDS